MDTAANSELVSCIIPTFRRSDTLSRAIASVLIQSYPMVEVLVVDDNEPYSADAKHVRRQVERFGDTRLRLICPDRHGNGAIARNVGIAHARGGLIAFLDDDDEWEPDKLRRQLYWMRRENVMAVACWHSLVSQSEVKECWKQPVSRPTKLDVLIRRVALTTPSLLVARTAFAGGLQFDERLRRHQDIQFVLDLLDSGELYIVPEYLVRVHLDDGSNRPSYRELKNIKTDFFRSVSSHLSGCTPQQRARALAAHDFELTYAAMKERKLGAMIRSFLRGFTSVGAYADLRERIRFRVEAKRIAENRSS